MQLVVHAASPGCVSVYTINTGALDQDGPGLTCKHAIPSRYLLNVEKWAVKCVVWLEYGLIGKLILHIQHQQQTDIHKHFVYVQRVYISGLKSYQ